MRTKLYIGIVLAATFLFSNCRKESDEINSSDYLKFAESNASTYTEIWDILWNGFNQNYVGWEIESVDWDKVNETYRPKLEELDEQVESANKKTAKGIEAEAEKIFHAAFDTLHDGHAYIRYLDYARPTINGASNYKAISPQEKRAKNRIDYEDEPALSILYYISDNQIEKDSIRVVNMQLILSRSLSELLPDLRAEQTKIEQSEKSSDEEYKQQLDNLISIIKDLITEYTKKNYYNYINAYTSGSFDLVMKKYELPYYESEDDPSTILSFITTDNIAYIRASSFMMPWDIEINSSETFKQNAIQQYEDVLSHWYEMIQQLHKSQKLKGVIIDMRNNHGGSTENLKYFAGTLFGNKDYVYGKSKTKNGIGRLDYGISVPVYVNHYSDNAEEISEPIAVLTNAQTISCAEVTTGAIKQHTNGFSVGMRTYGAGNTLLPDATDNSVNNYGGSIGSVNGVAYGYLPFCLTSYNGIGVIEGVGISPDIEVRYDDNLYQTTGRDNQLESALEAIRNGR